MRLNPLKCVFGVGSRKFLRFMVNQRGIEANPVKIKALVEMRSLTKPKEVQSLTVSEYAISSVLIRKDQGQQYPVYYVCKRLLDAETHYPQMEKLVFAMLVELSQFDIRYKPRSAIKWQALAYFILEFPSTEVALIEDKIDTAVPNGEGWTLYVDGASNSKGSGGGIILISPNNFKVNGEYLARGGRLAKYLAIVCELLQKFKKVVISQVACAHNSHADALARLASTREAELLDVIPVDVLTHPTVSRDEVMEIDVAKKVTWMTPIVTYLEKDILPDDKIEARKLRHRAARYVIYDGKLYRRSFSQPLLKCIDGEECDYILREVHGGISGNHTGGNSLALKIMRQGYYWPTLRQDASNFAKKCDKCQRIATYVNQPPSHLHSITRRWPFAVWGIDLIGELPKGKGRVKYAVVEVDYFTKWAEAKALATITAAKLREFVYNSIIWRFGIPYKLISNNEKQFDCKEMRQLCDELGMQSNGKTEAVNKIIKHTIKGKLEERKGYGQTSFHKFYGHTTRPPTPRLARLLALLWMRG
ncbi:uncharacterized protein LOC133030541 [Cannabis sativa]|uniref:uncharacterized protein LOC133030541 n=1 Tax=Cannabis sativa TaxID=3483 RepID=UPI0029CA8698|nr:uncharacterized protein LOC133030541 [Cannabis sativa]